MAWRRSRRNGDQFRHQSISLAQPRVFVTVRVKDNTSLVRDDLGGLLVQTVTWTELRLISPTALAGEDFAFRVTGNLGRTVAIQASPDLVNWSSLATNVFGLATTGSRTRRQEIRGATTAP